MSFSASDLMGETPQPATQSKATPTSAASQPTPDAGSFSIQDLQEPAQATQTKSALSPDEQASQTRQMLVSGLTGMPTPNMTATDKAQFEKGKAAGAVSVPIVAGATTGATAISEFLPSVLIHTVEGVKALGAWAEANPYKAFMLYQVAKEILPGARKAMGLIKGVPESD